MAENNITSYDNFTKKHDRSKTGQLYFMYMMYLDKNYPNKKNIYENYYEEGVDKFYEKGYHKDKDLESSGFIQPKIDVLHNVIHQIIKEKKKNKLAYVTFNRAAPLDHGPHTNRIKNFVVGGKKQKRTTRKRINKRKNIKRSNKHSKKRSKKRSNKRSKKHT